MRVSPALPSGGAWYKILDCANGYYDNGLLFCQAYANIAPAVIGYSVCCYDQFTNKCEFKLICGDYASNEGETSKIKLKSLVENNRIRVWLETRNLGSKVMKYVSMTNKIAFITEEPAQGATFISLI